MRHDKRYWRVHNLITAPEIPRMADGEGVRLCHNCQRWLSFFRGFIPLLLRDLAMAAEAAMRRKRGID